MSVVQIEKQKIEFLLPIEYPLPKHHIGQLVEIYSTVDHKTPDKKAWFTARIVGMAYTTEWEYTVKYLNCSGECFDYVTEANDIHLLEG